MSDFTYKSEEVEYSPSNDITKNFGDKKDQVAESDFDQYLSSIQERIVTEQANPPQKPAPAAIRAAQEKPAEGEDAPEDAGVVEEVVVRGIGGGIRDAVQEVFDGAASFNEWVDATFPNFGELQLFDDEGSFNMEWLSAEEARQENLKYRAALPEVQKPTSISGNLARGVSQFATGFIPLFKAAGAIGKGGKVGTTARTITASAATDFAVFDPHAERLSNLVEEYPVLQNPVSEYLAADPNDSEAEGRFKNVVEGLVIDTTLAGAFIGSMKMFRGAQNMYGKPTSEVRKAVKGKDVVIPRDKPAEQIFDDTKPLVEVKEATDEQVEAFTLQVKSETGNKAANINLDRLATTDDVKEAIGLTADLLGKDLKKATRGQISNKETIKAAEQMGLDADKLLRRTQGEAFNAEQIVAARNILVSSGENLKMMAKTIQEGKATDIDRVKFRQAVATHAAIQKQVSGLTAEAGRALQSFRIQAKSTAEQTRAINNILGQNGGRGAVDDLAEAISTIDDPAKLNKFTRDATYASSLDMVQEAWVNSILSGPATHMTNIMSNALLAITNIPERAFAATIAKLFPDGEVTYKEMMGQSVGLLRGTTEGWKMAKEAFKTEGLSDPLTKIDMADRRAITAENLSRSILGKRVVNPMLKTMKAKNLDEGGYAANFADMLGSAVRLPGYRMLSSEDAFFKGLNYRMEINAQAIRLASQQGLTGDALARRAAEIVENPPAELRKIALDTADVNTFTNYNKLAASVNRFREEFPTLKFFLPFVTTPANVVSYAIQRTPFAAVSKGVRDDIAAGGARRDLAMGRIAAGTSAMWGAWNLASQGAITGAAPSDPGLRKVWLQENQEYSLKFKTLDGKTTFVSYNRFEPVGMLFGLSADFYNIRSGTTQKDEDDFGGAFLMALQNNLISKTYMQGVSDLMSALDPNNPFSSFDDIIANIGAGFVPNFINQANRSFIDQTARDTRDVNLNQEGESDFLWGMMDKMKAKVPGYSKQFPARRNLWGEKIEIRQGFNDGTGEMIFNYLSPAYVTKRDEDPVNNWLIDNDIGITMPKRTLKIPGYKRGVPLTAEEYNTYLELSGQPAKQRLDKLVPSGAFEGLSDDMKQDAVRNVISETRRNAKQDLLEIFPDIAERVESVNEVR